MHCDGSFPACLAADGVDCRLNSNALLHTTWRPKKTGVKTGVKLKSVFRFAHYSAIFGGAKRNLLRVKIRPSSAKRKVFFSARLLLVALDELLAEKNVYTTLNTWWVT
jgi:hypothetical protein